MSEGANAEKKKSPAVIALIVAVCLVAAVLIGEGVMLVLSRLKPEEPTEETTTEAQPVEPVEIGDGFALFIKDGKVFIDVSKDHSQVQLTTLQDPSDRIGAVKYGSAAKRLFFTVSAGGGTADVLYGADLNVKETKDLKAEKIADGVREFYVRGGGKTLVCLTAGRSLFVLSDLTKPPVTVGADADRLVASDTSAGMYYISWPGGAQTGNGGPNVLYSFDDTGSATALDNGMYHDEAYAGEHAVVAYIKNGAVYCCSDGAAPAKAADLPQGAVGDSARVLLADEGNRVCYSVTEKLNDKIGDHVTDVYAQTDAAMAETAAGYAAKQKRDAVRKLLSEPLSAGETRSVYSAFPGGAAALLADNVSDCRVLSADGVPRMVLFLCAPLDPALKLSISELTDCVDGGYTAETVSKYLLTSMSGAFSMKLYAQGAVSELGSWVSKEAYNAEGDIAGQIQKTFGVASDGSAIYYILKVKNEETLIRRVMNGGRTGSPESFGSKILQYRFLSAGLFTLRGAPTDATCSVYLDAVSLGTDRKTAQGQTVIDCGNGAFYYTGGYSGAPLNFYNGSASVKVSGNVSAAAGAGGTAVYFIDSASSALKYHNGEKTADVASGVSAVYTPVIL